MTTSVYARQFPLLALADLGSANAGTGLGLTIALPVNAFLLDVSAHVVTAFNGTTNTVTASDGTITFISAEDAKQVAGTDVTVDNSGKGTFYPSGGTITFSVAQTGDNTTAGRIIGQVQYVIVGRQNENQF